MNEDKDINEDISENYKATALALSRRTTPSLFAHKLVGVQPMAAPAGIAFAMRQMYGYSMCEGCFRFKVENGENVCPFWAAEDSINKDANGCEEYMTDVENNLNELDL